MSDGMSDRAEASRQEAIDYAVKAYPYFKRVFELSEAQKEPNVVFIHEVRLRHILEIVWYGVAVTRLVFDGSGNGPVDDVSSQDSGN